MFCQFIRARRRQHDRERENAKATPHSARPASNGKRSAILRARKVHAWPEIWVSVSLLHLCFFPRIFSVCVGVWVGAVICIRGHFVSVDAFVSYSVLSVCCFAGNYN
jgi:hypothetical protein